MAKSCPEHRETCWRELGARVAGVLRPAGLDLVHPFPVGAYNSAVEPRYALPDFGRPDGLGLLVGNSRVLWSRFLDALRARPALLEDPAPLDGYVAEQLGDALAGVHVQHEVRYAHEPEPRRVAVQRLAHLSGLAWLSPSHLAIHRIYGPWIALRAVVVFDLAGPEDRPEEPVDPCGRCAVRCLPLFHGAVEAVGETAAHETVIERWREWLAFRDACPVGRAYRYFGDQIVYHYTRDRAVLMDAIRRRSRIEGSG